MGKYRGRIVNIQKIHESVTHVVQGVKKSNQHKYSQCIGGNGSYVTGNEYLGTHLYVKVFVYDLKKSYTVDIYQEIKNAINKTKISPQCYEIIKTHEGDKITVEIVIEIVVEVIGETKVQVIICEPIELLDDNFENEINEDFICEG
jgi:hypothetical protein